MSRKLRLYDLSLTIHEKMVIWPGDPAVRLTRVRSIQTDGVSVSSLTTGTHTGTHLDAPAHLLPDGLTVEALALEPLVGPAYVAYLPEVAIITAQVLEGLALPASCRRLLFRTRNSDEGLLVQGDFRPDYVALAEDAAQWLVERDYLLVGLDALSIDAYQEQAGVAHRLLLSQKIAVIEGVDLRQVPPGEYMLCCLPLKILGADGAPVRAVLMAT